MDIQNKIHISGFKPLKSGFTLIEISIVLVIIGLIVGGILVGQNLIEAAALRATISQVEKYNTSANAFRLKYGYLPGDLLASRATDLGFFSMSCSLPTPGCQDGNGLIEGTGPFLLLLGERIAFWRHLTDAQMIDGNYGTATSGNALISADGVFTSDITANTVNQVFPPAKIGRGNYVFVYATQGVTNLGENYFQIAGMTAMDDSGWPYTLTLALTPIEAAEIDQKKDDGLPMSGKTRAMRSTTILGTAAIPGDACVTAASLYDVGATNGSTPNCQLRLKMN